MGCEVNRAERILASLDMLESGARSTRGFFLQPADAKMIKGILDLLMLEVEVKDRSITEMRAEITKLRKFIDTGEAT